MLRILFYVDSMSKSKSLSLKCGQVAKFLNEIKQLNFSDENNVPWECSFAEKSCTVLFLSQAKHMLHVFLFGSTAVVLFN